jgi:hypothetical protein
MLEIPVGDEATNYQQGAPEGKPDALSRNPSNDRQSEAHADERR